MKPANNLVLDSSAVLAWILKEPGGERVNVLLAQVAAGKAFCAAISSVNWCEVLTRLFRDNSSMTAQELDALLAGVELVPLGRVEAEMAAEYSRFYPELSLGDRVCLALAYTRKATAWTTDKIWARAKVGVPIEILR